MKYFPGFYVKKWLCSGPLKFSSLDANITWIICKCCASFLIGMCAWHYVGDSTIFLDFRSIVGDEPRNLWCNCGTNFTTNVPEPSSLLVFISALFALFIIKGLKNSLSLRRN